MPAKSPELTEAEWAIMKAVWAAQPCAAPDVQEALADSHGWTCSTVRTFMDRMVGKGLLTAEKIRNLTLYRAAVTRRQAQLVELRCALWLLVFVTSFIVDPAGNRVNPPGQ
jgi:BlaI family penicillinase repressor